MMQKIKTTYRMWLALTSRRDKAIHSLLVGVGIVNIIATAAVIPTAQGVATSFLWFLFVLAVIMWNTWRGAYICTEHLRSMGAQVAEALKQHTFIHMTQADGTYYIQPEHVDEHPDDLNGEVFTDEIVIRRGIDSDGTDITAYRIPNDLDEIAVIGLLETTKVQYLQDKMEENES